MKFSTKGLGWLIAGALVCLSATASYGVADAASTIAIGMVFIAVYLMKQRFRPRGIGWFIAGGIVLAYCLDLLIQFLGEAFTGHDNSSGGPTDLLISLVVAGVCMVLFYLRNKADLQDVADDMGHVEYNEFPGQEEVFGDLADEAEEQTSAEEAEEQTSADDTEIEFDFEPAEEDPSDKKE